MLREGFNLVGAIMKIQLSLFSVLLCLNLLNEGKCYLELDHENTVYGIVDKQVTLQCIVNSDKSIKEVIWYKDALIGNQEKIYHYEPGHFIDVAIMDRTSRSLSDETSLVISPIYLRDEAWYICRATVWDLPSNVSSEFVPPEEKSVRMKLVVYVPPEQVQLSTFAASSNMSLICKSLGSKPAAEITWLKTQSSGENVEIPSEKATVVNHEKLADVTGFLYFMLSGKENAARISCVVKHPETNTTKYKNVTIVSPFIQNAVEIYMEKLGSTVAYSVVGNQNYDDSDNPAAGLVKISADPGLHVTMNSSVTLKASAPGVFPEPSYLWWNEDESQVVHSGSEIVIENLQSDITYNVLAKNQVGRIVLAVPLTVVDEESLVEQNSSISTSTENETEVVMAGGLNGGLIAVIVIGVLLFCLLVGLAIWYLTCKRVPNEGIPNKKKSSHRHVEETDGFILPSAKPLMRTTSTQTLEGKKRQKKGSQRSAASEDNLLASTSRKLDDKNFPPQYATTERPMDKHLKEYDEQASFAGDYGSGLESEPSAENLHSAQEGDTRSEGSSPDSEDSRNVKVPTHQEAIV